MSGASSQTTTSKSPGPDSISGHLFKHCADQLCFISHLIIKCSLERQNVPRLLKQSTIVPVAKNKSPRGICDFRPAALTSLVMKALEKLIKRELVGVVEDSLDPL